MKNYMIFLWIASIAIAIITGIVVYRSIKNDKHMNLAYFMVLLSGFVIIITSYCHWATNQYTYGMNYQDMKTTPASSQMLSYKTFQDADIYDDFKFTGKTKNLSIPEFVDSMIHFKKNFSKNCELVKNTESFEVLADDLTIIDGSYLSYEGNASLYYRVGSCKLKPGQKYILKYDKSILVHEMGYNYYDYCKLYEAE